MLTLLCPRSSWIFRMSLAGFEQVRGERMSQAMTPCLRLDARLAHCLPCTFSLRSHHLLSCGNTHCHFSEYAAFGYFRSSAAGIKTRPQREHEWTDPSVPAEADQHGVCHPGRLRRDSREAQLTTQEEARLQDPGGVLCTIVGSRSGRPCVAIQT